MKRMMSAAAISKEKKSFVLSSSASEWNWSIIPPWQLQNDTAHFNLSLLSFETTGQDTMKQASLDLATELPLLRYWRGVYAIWRAYHGVSPKLEQLNSSQVNLVRKQHLSFPLPYKVKLHFCSEKKKSPPGQVHITKTFSYLQVPLLCRHYGNTWICV